MTPNRTGILISLTLHGGAIALAYALSCSIAQPIKPIEIDFTLLEPAGPPVPEPPPVVRKPLPEPPAPPRKQKAPAVEQAPRIVQQAPVPREPATQPQGSVPIFANPNPTPPVPPQQASAQTGTGSAGGSATGTGQGTGGGGGVSADKLRKKYLAEQYEYIKRIIEENLVYPSRAQRMGWNGSCVVEFVVQSSGHAKDIHVIKSTGYELLDDNVVETIQKVDPFPKPPAPVKLKIPFTYRLG